VILLVFIYVVLHFCILLLIYLVEIMLLKLLCLIYVIGEFDLMADSLFSVFSTQFKLYNIKCVKPRKSQF